MKKLRMPGAFTILFVLTIVAIGLTWIIPAGQFSKISYDEPSKKLMITTPDGKQDLVPATQEELKKLNIKIDVNEFTSGAITKPVSIPDTYQRLEQRAKGISDLPTSMVQGTIESVDIVIFILVLGGMIGVVKASGAFESGLVALTKKTKGHEFILIFLTSILMILGGTFVGLEEEAVAFYPILVPAFIAMGYDSIVCVGAIFLSSSIGTAFSTINPFSVVIASNAAGINFTEGLGFRIFGCAAGAVFVIGYLYWYSKKVKADPSFSYTYEDSAEFKRIWSMKSDEGKPFNTKNKIVLLLFVAAFPLMVWGVMSQGWWFPKMASSFLTITIIIMFLTGLGKNSLSEKEVVDAFVEGASSLVGVSLIIGLARGVNAIMNDGLISDTILNYLSNLVAHSNGVIFIIIMMFIFFVLGFVVPSSSGLAVLAMPIFAPLADSVHIPRFVIVTAYQFGQYAMLFLAPTGLIMATLQMLDMKYSHWFKFVMPVVLFLLIFGGGILVTEVLLYSY